MFDNFAFHFQTILVSKMWPWPSPGRSSNPSHTPAPANRYTTNFINQRCSDLPVNKTWKAPLHVWKKLFPSHQQSRLHNTCRNCSGSNLHHNNKKLQRKCKVTCKTNIIEPSNENQVYKCHNSSEIKIKPGSKVKSNSYDDSADFLKTREHHQCLLVLCHKVSVHVHENIPNHDLREVKKWFKEAVGCFAGVLPCHFCSQFWFSLNNLAHPMPSEQSRMATPCASMTLISFRPWWFCGHPTVFSWPLSPTDTDPGWETKTRRKKDANENVLQ